MTTTKRIFACLLAMTMLVSAAVCGGVSAWAEELKPVTLEPTDIDNQLAYIYSQIGTLKQNDSQNTFTKLKLNGIILKQRGSLAIATDRIECDLYDWLEKKQESRYHYLGDYMNQYSWPEVMHAELDEIAWSFDDDQ